MINTFRYYNMNIGNSYSASKLDVGHGQAGLASLMKQSDLLIRLKKECTNPTKAYRISHLYRNVKT